MIGTIEKIVTNYANISEEKNWKGLKLVFLLYGMMDCSKDGTGNDTHHSSPP